MESGRSALLGAARSRLYRAPVANPRKRADSRSTRAEHEERRSPCSWARDGSANREPIGVRCQTASLKDWPVLRHSPEPKLLRLLMPIKDKTSM